MKEESGAECSGFGEDLKIHEMRCNADVAAGSIAAAFSGTY